MRTEYALRVDALSKSYGAVRALDGISFAIPRGQATAVIGQNGAGKTTLVEIILNLRRADAGLVEVDGVDVAANPRKVASIGAQLQEAALFPSVRVARYLKLFSKLYGAPPPSPELIRRLGLEDHLDKKLSDLSGGLKQRAMLAFSLINDPDLLILDEPSTGLDPVARELLWSFIEEWVEQGRKTLLLTSHYMDEVERLCQRVIVLAGGRIVADGSVPSLLDGMPETVTTLQGAYSRLVGAQA